MDKENQVYTLQTKDFGEIEYYKDQVYRFENGLVGMEENKEYVLLYYNEKYYILHSLDHSDLYFILTEPGFWDIKMSFNLDEKDLESLGTDKPDDLSVLLTAKIAKAEKDKSSLNFKAPIILNTSSNMAIQKIIQIGENTLDFIMDEEKATEPTKLPIDSK